MPAAIISIMIYRWIIYLVRMMVVRDEFPSIDTSEILMQMYAPELDLIDAKTPISIISV